MHDLSLEAKLTAYSKFPAIYLYMDQVLSLLETELQAYREIDEAHSLTASMVNNYVKQGIIKPPVKKRYGQEQIAQLIILTLCKSVLSLAQIKLLFEADEAAGISIEARYEQFTGFFANPELQISKNPADQAFQLALLALRYKLEAIKAISQIKEEE